MSKFVESGPMLGVARFEEAVRGWSIGQSVAPVASVVFLGILLVCELAGAGTLGFEPEEDFTLGPIEFSDVEGIDAEMVSLEIEADDDDHGQVLSIRSADGLGFLEIPVFDPTRGEALLSMEIAGSGRGVESIEIGTVVMPLPEEEEAGAWRKLELFVGPDGLEVSFDGAVFEFLELSLETTFRFLPGAGEIRLDLLAWEPNPFGSLNGAPTGPSLPPVPPQALGGVLRDVWLGIGGSGLSKLKSHPDFPSLPAFSDVLPTFEAPTKWANTYGTRLRALLTAPASGSYTFWIAGDDQSELWLSDSIDERQKVLIASVPGWSPVHGWDKYPEQRSTVISLVEGQQYYLEALHKEGWGGDHLSVAWSSPLAPDRQVISGAFLTPFENAPRYGGDPDFVLNAGPDQYIYLPRQSFVLNGKAFQLRNSDGEPTVQWYSVGLSGASIETPNQLESNVWVPTYGEYVFELRSTLDGESYFDEVKVTVYPELAPDVGGVTREAWLGVKGSSVSSLSDDQRFPEFPDLVDQLPSFVGPMNWANQFGTRARAYLHPPVDGLYRFWVAGDDSTVLKLSPAENPEDAVVIALAPKATRLHQIDRSSEQQSEAQRLLAGQRYYIEVLQKDNWGGDHFSVFWQGPLQSKPEILSGEFLTPYGKHPAFDPAAILIALAGKDRVLHSPRREMTLRGGFRYLQNTDREPKPAWSLIHGDTSAVIVNPGALETRVTFPAEGVYEFQLALDDDVEMAKDTVQVEIRSAISPEVGGITREVWLGITGKKVADLTDSGALDQVADLIDVMPALELPSNWNNDYGTRMRGYLTPPESGLYELWIASDASSELWLSPDENPAHAVKVASLTQWAGKEDWDRRSSQHAEGIELVAGQRYYVEALFKEARGADYFAAAWRGPGIPDREIISGSYLIPFQPAPFFLGELQILLEGDSNTYWPNDRVPVAARVFDLDEGPAEVAVRWEDGVAGTGVSFVDPSNLETEAIFPGPGNYLLRLTASDGSHERVAELEVTVHAPLSPDVGGISRHVWFGIGSSKLSTLTEHPDFPARPFLRDRLPRLATPIDWSDSYGTRLQGYLQVPESGEFTFWIAGDDQSELYLSSDDTPANRQRIGFVKGWTNVAQWNRYPEQQSEPVILAAGTRYYIEVLNKEGGGGDHVEVAWEGPGIPSRQIIHGGFLSPYEAGTLADPTQSLFVNAGIDQRHYQPRSRFRLSGTFRYLKSEDGKSPSFEWQLVSGAAPGRIVIENPESLEATVHILDPGQHVFELRGSDGVDQHADRVVIEILAPLAPDVGGINREVWLGVRGKTIESLLESERYLGDATISDVIPQLEVPSNWANDYGARFRGYLHVPTTGDYSFFLSSDDYSELWLSTGESPGDAVRVAFVNSWNRQRDWFRKPYQSSGAIRLESGQRYYLEAFHKEGGGSDHFAVGWTGPDWGEPQVIDGSFLSAFAPAARFNGQIQLLTAASYELVWPDSQLPLQGLAFDLSKGPRSLDFYWQVLNGGSVSFSDPDSQLTTAIFDSPGDYVIRFGAGDGVNDAYRDISVSIVPPAGTGPNGLLREVWLNLNGVRVSNLVESNRFPDVPTFSDIVANFETPRDWADNYGTRLRGYVYPPETGTYYFWLSGDDYSDLYIGEDGTDSNTERIAWIEGWTNYRQWDRYPTQRSRALELNAGQRYYVEVLQKERSGADHVEVGWTRSESEEPVIIPGGYLEPFGPASTSAADLLVVAGPDVVLAWPEQFLELEGLVYDLRPGPYQVVSNWEGEDAAGNDVLFTRDNSMVATAVFPGPGDYTLRLNANDGLNVGFDELSVHVSSAVSSNSGRILREVYEGISGSRIRHLEGAPNFPSAPDVREILSSLRVPSGWGNNYGTRIRGFLHPPVDGDYQFWVSGDDETVLRIGETDRPDSAYQIARVPSWTQPEQWDKFPEQASELISLSGGNRYYIEILHKEGGGGDHLAAAWTGPGLGELQIIGGDFLSPFSATDDLEPPVITLQGPMSQTIFVGADYVEPGYQAFDNEDGDLTGWVEVIGAVDPSVPGAYHVAYVVYDASGNRSDLVSRQVQVERPVGVGTSDSWPPPVPPGFVPPVPSGWTLPGSVSSQDAARFLAQSTFGPSRSEIYRVQSLGIEDWIDEQMSLDSSLHAPHLKWAMTLLGDGFNDFGQDVSGVPSVTPRSPRVDDRMYSWWTHAIEAPDQLRQRVAFALSEILVVSDRSPALQKYPVAVANYYDIMVRNAFGNYRDIMEEVSLSPMMGIYLTIVRSSKADPEAGLLPDENYGRELLQLFTIGLKWLNPDGTDQRDGDDNPIPTYGMDEILAFSRVFTGWTFSGSSDFFWARKGEADLMSPMMAFEAYHDTDPKTLFGGVTLPANQSAYDDLSDALDNIFHHPNMGPFLARGLIQRLVTSNPSPGYIYRVASAFDDNGQGVRGDMAAVVEAVLVDEEARDPARLSDAGYGKQREPIVRLTHLIRAFYEFQSDSPPALGRFGFGSSVLGPLGQAPVYAPSVFNFFDKDYSPSGVLQNEGLVAPEFQITSEVRAIDSANFMHQGIDRGFASGSGFADRIALNLAAAIAVTPDVEQLLDYLDLVLMANMMSAEMRDILRSTLADISQEPQYRGESAIQLIVTSPQFIIQR